jgi:RNA polymerase sigma-70 factor (ECF subfamily)
MKPLNNQITEMLSAWNDGDKTSLEGLVPLVELELKRIARRYLRKESANVTLMTSDLINEAYIKLLKQREPQWKNRSHFFAISSIIIRRILINHARDRSTAKRGGSAVLLNIDDIEIMSSKQSVDLVNLDESLENLAKLDPLKARIVELRYFGGLSTAEIGEVLGLTTIAVDRNWKLARAWLASQISK